MTGTVAVVIRIRQYVTTQGQRTFRHTSTFTVPSAPAIPATTPTKTTARSTTAATTTTGSSYATQADERARVQDNKRCWPPVVCMCSSGPFLFVAAHGPQPTVFQFAVAGRGAGKIIQKLNLGQLAGPITQLEVASNDSPHYESSVTTLPIMSHQ